MDRCVAAEEVWLFGSYARDESNVSSDVDVLVVCDGADVPRATVAWLRRKFGGRLDVAHYSYRGLEGLAAKASLFTWHLRYEGVPLWRRRDRLAGILAKMRPYAAHGADLDVLLAVLDDAAKSLAARHAVQFDLGVVGTVVRNAGIIMHDLLGSRDFSPEAPVRLSSIRGAPKLPIGEADYRLMQACRRASERGERVELGVPTTETERMIEGVRQWLGVCVERAKVWGE